MDMADQTAPDRSMPAPPLRPKHASGFMQNMVNGINRLEQRATGSRRKKFEAKQLPPGKDIFHGYEFPQAPSAATKTAGRKPYNWTPKRSRELIKLIIHTDLKFDDISTAMKDESGDGPSETTCRNHWHEIFGYSPDMARLKYGKGRERRLREHMEAYDAHRRKMKTLGALTVAAELQHSGPRAARSSKASSTMEHSRTSSIYADSGIQVDDESPDNKQSSDENVDVSQHNSSVPEFYVTPANPSETMVNSASTFEGYGIRPGLSSVQEDDEAPEHHTRPISPNPAPEEISPEDIQGVAPDRRLSSIPGASKTPGGKTVDQIEEKEGLPNGFIGWFRKISLGSNADSRHPSTASYASRTSLRFSHSVRNSVATSISMGYHHERVPKDAICKYLGNNNALVEPSAGYVEELIQRGANVNARNARGETPLHFAVGRGAIVICTILLQHGADADAKSLSGETIWDFGRRVSKSTLNPEGTYDKREQLLRTMVAARIEFLRATIKFNPEMIVEEPERAKRRRNSDQNAAVNAWSRSGAGSGGGRKKSKAVTPKLERSPSVAQRSPSIAQSIPTPTLMPESSMTSPAGSTEISNEATPQPSDQNQWQHLAQTEQPIQEYTAQTNDVSYFPEPQDFSLYGNHTNFTQPFSTDAVDAIYTDLPREFFEGQEFQVDPQAFDLAASSFQEDNATLHASQDMGYLNPDHLGNNGQHHAQASPGDHNNVQQYSQTTPEGLTGVQQYAGTTMENMNTVQQYGQASPENMNNIQQYAHTMPETTHNIQQYAQANPANLSSVPQYSHPSPPACPEGTVSPAHLSISASPPQMSPPGQYFGDYPSHIERENSHTSSIDPAVQPTYSLGMDHTMQHAGASLPHDGQAYTGYPMASYVSPDHAWSTYQHDQNQSWENAGGYSH